VILLDTSVLVDTITGPRRSLHLLRRAYDRGEFMLLPAIALFEWLRGPRLPEEIAVQEALFPPEACPGFGPDEVRIAAELYRSLPRARDREMDLAIAASALLMGAEVWTLNVRDFRDIPGLRLYAPD